MSAKIFYFSGTGNTLKLARDLADALGNTELIRISPDTELDQTDCDTAGIAYPVYAFGLPKIVADFIKKVNFSEKAYIFGLASYGGLLANSGINLEKLLKKKGYTLAAGFAVQMPGNAVTVYDIPPEEKRESMYKNEEKRIKEIASIVKQRKPSRIEKKQGLPGKLMSGVNPTFSTKVHDTDKNFSVENTCDGCGICEKVCPVNNIRMVNNRPEWQHRCQSCLACLHWCPQQAIQAGKKTKSRARYHHPDITIKDMTT